jgi:ATP-binding cassette subfamily C (CFTR/MRP) protein 4
MQQAATIGLVYRKALKISQHALTQTTTGHVVNLVSNDAERFIMAAIMLPWLFIAPLQLSVVTWLVYSKVGWPSLLATALLILLVPVQLRIGKYIGYLRRETSKLTDERVKTMKELISGMRVVKMQGWEGPFGVKVDALRAKELSYIQITNMIKGCNMAMSFITPALLAAVVFIPYAQTVGSLNAAMVFSTMSYFIAVRVNVTIFFAFGIQARAELWVVFERLQNFLLLEEKEPVLQNGSGSSASTLTCTTVTSNTINTNGTESPLQPVVQMVGFECAWDKSRAVLNDVTFALNRGELLGVVGPVGAGKSTLLAAILGEVPASKGILSVNGRVAYSSQESWILGETVRSNILFGTKLNVARYEEVVRACQLDTDLDAFPDGDLTEIGDRGITLSGGQRARISLARAAYAEADVYLLDDPLSAVDATVGKQLVEQCIVGLLVGRGAAVVLVTHQLQFLNHVDRVLMLDPAGRVDGLGTVAALEAAGKTFESARAVEGADGEGKRDAIAGDPKTDVDDEPNRTSKTHTDGGCSTGDDDGTIQSKQTGKETKKRSSLHQAEGRQDGVVTMSTYSRYMKSGASMFTGWYGARFPTEIYTRGCHWIPRMFA